MRIVVTGGTGFIGRHLVEALVARRDEVTVLTRSPQRARARAGVKFVGWDPVRAETWADTARECDAVVHLAGENVFDKRWTEKRKQQLRVSRIESTARIARVLGGTTQGPRTFVSASAVGIYGARVDDAPSPEGDRTGGDFLADLCIEWEKAADPARDAGVRVTHPRIGIVLGQGGGVLPPMVTASKLFVGGPIGSGSQYLSWIHVRDVVRAILHGIDSDILGAYNAVAPEPATMGDVARAIGESLHRPAAARVPGFAVRLALGGEMARTLLGGQRALPVRLQERGFTFDFPTLQAALSDLLHTRSHAA